MVVVGGGGAYLLRASPYKSTFTYHHTGAKVHGVNLRGEIVSISLQCLILMQVKVT